MKTTKIKNYWALTKLLDYDTESGVLSWKSCVRNGRSGNKAGHIHDKNNGYRKVKHKNSRYACHILAWMIVYGKTPDNEIDHIDGNPDNNAVLNLRDVTASTNQRNSPRISKGEHIAMAGVRKVGYKWVVQCCGEDLGSTHCLGQAIKARRAKERELGGFTRRHSLR